MISDVTNPPGSSLFGVVILRLVVHPDYRPPKKADATHTQAATFPATGAIAERAAAPREIPAKCSIF